MDTVDPPHAELLVSELQVMDIGPYIDESSLKDVRYAVAKLRSG